MKKVLLASFSLLVSFAYSQSTTSLETFDAIDSDIGATINIMKAAEHKLSIHGDEKIQGLINWEVDEKSLKIRSSNIEQDFNNVVITIHTPHLSVLTLKDGGKATMDGKFSRLDSFVVSATDSATIDLSNIEFKTLVATSKDGGNIIYKNASTIVRSSDDGGKIKSIQ